MVRWEFRPGSTLYFVWTQSRSVETPDGSLDFGRDVASLRGADSENIFVVKMSYWIGL